MAVVGAPDPPPRTEGERLLRTVQGSLAEISRKLGGVGRSQISEWRRGVKVPDDDSRANIERCLRIPRETWTHRLTPSVPPGAPGATSSDPPEDDTSSEDPTASPREAAQAYLRRIQRLRATAQMQNSSDLHKLLDLERKAIMDLARFSGELTATDENKLCETRRWRQIRDVISETLVAYPDAARAVADKLVSIGAS